MMRYDLQEVRPSTIQVLGSCVLSLHLIFPLTRMAAVGSNSFPVYACHPTPTRAKTSRRDDRMPIVRVTYSTGASGEFRWARKGVSDQLSGDTRAPRPLRRRGRRQASLVARTPDVRIGSAVRPLASRPCFTSPESHTEYAPNNSPLDRPHADIARHRVRRRVRLRRS